MNAAILKAWQGYARRWEGVTTWMYLDTKFKVTTGVGFLIDSIAAAQALPWVVRATGHLASPAEVADEWRRVKAHTRWAPLGGGNPVWSTLSRMRITQKTIDDRLGRMTEQFWAGLKKSLPALDDYPADAGLAILDEGWQNGWAYLEMKERNGSYTWANTRAALLARDFARAADAVPGSGPRADFRKRLFRNAAVVQAARMDTGVLWDTRTPTPPPAEGFDMAAAEDLYLHGTIDQPVEANTDTFVFLNDKQPARGNSAVIGTNPGVHAGLVVTFHATAAVKVALWPVLVDTKKDASDLKMRHQRVHGWHAYAAGTNWEIVTSWRGAVPKPSADDRNNRLRFMIRATGPITIVNTEVTGWEMP